MLRRSLFEKDLVKHDSSLQLQVHLTDQRVKAGTRFLYGCSALNGPSRREDKSEELLHRVGSKYNGDRVGGGREGQEEEEEEEENKKRIMTKR
ncbi:hypothetical protein EYF80_024154 [Liparis tanakae]|uniref:Uncharacterized protein n=1 Tax=Liparis tanakae TaxID=230148 RepID=A0A4Z2HK13_9TELE|nr:hypothetical protein EYF80_024154 [Liparis tanakae]